MYNWKFLVGLFTISILFTTLFMPSAFAQTNQPPTVSINSPEDGFLTFADTVFTVFGSAEDSNGTSLSHLIQWSSDKDGFIAQGSAAFVVLSLGEHVLTAQVTDSQGLSSSDSITVTMIELNANPQISITSPVSGSEFIEGESILFSATATDTEDGNISHLTQWSSNIDDFLGAGSPISSTLSVGEHTITAQVTDSGGRTSFSLRMITVIEDPLSNTAPDVSITSPADNLSFQEGQSILFEGTGIDSQDGNISSNLRWTSNIDGLFRVDDSFTMLGLSVDTHIITASVVDSGGLEGSDQITVTINPISNNNPPTISLFFPPNNSQYQQGDSIPFSASAFDINEGDLSPSIQWSSDRDGVLGTGGGFFRSDLSVGTHIITASVTDSEGASDSKQSTITVYELQPCSPPSSGNWIITSSCVLSVNDSAPGNVIVQNNSVLEIPNGVILDIDFTNFNLTIKFGSGVLIKAGGTLT